MSQILLPLAHRGGDGDAEFLVSASNMAAVAALERWPDWPGHCLVLVGPAGCGKSHLAVLAGSRAAALQVVEDADRVPLDEAALFHAWNAAQAGGPDLLLTARVPPARWPLRLPDLRSRLLSAQLAELADPDDELLVELIGRSFQRRGIIVSPLVINYMVQRIERSHAAALDAVARTDALAAAQKRPITVQLVREAIGEGRR
jgi:chromosomal replication initiation ATPase DnaA